MRIRMISLASGPEGTFQPGKVYTAPADLPVSHAEAFVAAGAAIALNSPPAPETAALAPAEQAVMPRGKPKKGA